MTLLKNFIDCICIGIFINIVSKLGSAPITHTPAKNQEPTSPNQAPGSKAHSGVIPPALNTNALSVPGSLDTSGLGLTEPQLRRQSLECLVGVLKSLVTWGTTSSAGGPSDSPGETRSSVPPPDESREDTVTPDPSLSLDRLNNPPLSASESRQPTPDVSDDPSRFESAKQRKTTLLEGIKKFNFKPKRVGRVPVRRMPPTELLTGHRVLLGNWLHSEPFPDRHCALPP